MNSIFKILCTALLFTIISCSSAKKATNVDNSEEGHSFEKAIVVKNISQEYDYVKRVCPDCKFLKQSLRTQGKKHYDLLVFDNAGTEITYYFDIDSFYGKLF